MALAKIAWRATYSSFFKNAAEGLLKDTLYDAAGQIIDPEKKHKPKLGETEVMMQINGTPKGKLVASLRVYLKESFFPSKTREALLDYSSPPTSLNTPQIDLTKVPLPDPRKAHLEIPDVISKAATEPLTSKNLDEDPKLNYALAKARFIMEPKKDKTTNAPDNHSRTMNGWAYLNWMVMEEFAEGNGIVDIYRLCERIKLEFPDLEAKVGAAGISIFAHYRSLGELARTLSASFAQTAEIYSYLIYKEVKDIQKVMPIYEDENP